MIPNDALQSGEHLPSKPDILLHHEFSKKEFSSRIYIFFVYRMAIIIAFSLSHKWCALRVIGKSMKHVC